MAVNSVGDFTQDGTALKDVEQTLTNKTLASPIVTGELSIGDGNLTTEGYSTSLNDDEYVDLEAGKTGWGTVMAGDNEEFAPFTFTSAGVVTLLTDATANVVNTDTDAKLCIFDNGTNVRIRNRLGSAKVIRFCVNYS